MVQFNGQNRYSVALPDIIQFVKYLTLVEHMVKIAPEDIHKYPQGRFVVNTPSKQLTISPD